MWDGTSWGQSPPIAADTHSGMDKVQGLRATTLAREESWLKLGTYLQLN